MMIWGHQLVMAIVKWKSLKLVLLTSTYHSAECDTDHSLVCCKIRLQPKKLHRTRQAGKPHINATMMQYTEKIEDFVKYFKDALSVDHSHNSSSEKWDHHQESIQKTAFAVFGKKTSKNSEMTPVKTGCPCRIQALTKCEIPPSSQICQEQNSGAATGNIRGMDKGIKRTLGPSQSNPPPHPPMPFDLCVSWRS